MSKPRTKDDLYHQLESGRTWRLKEISDLKTITLRSDSAAQKVLLRAMVAICYAHWEGYVRPFQPPNATSAYVTLKRPRRVF